MSRTEAQKKADRKYYNDRYKQVAFKLNKVTDADVLAYLEKVDNVRAFLIDLIRDCIILENCDLYNVGGDDVVNVDSLYPKTVLSKLPKETLKAQQEKIKRLIEIRRGPNKINAYSLYGLYGLYGFYGKSSK